MGGYPLKDRKNLKKLTREQNAQNKETVIGSGAPGVSDDSSNPEIGVGTLWIDSATGALYVCTDATVGAAVWVRASGDSEVALWRYGGPSTYLTVLVTNGIAVELLGGDGSYPGGTVVSVADFQPIVKGPDPDVVPAFGISIAPSAKPTMFTDPEDAYLTVDCDSDGTLIVWIWVEDSEGIGSDTFTETYVLLQDNGGVCAGP